MKSKKTKMGRPPLPPGALKGTILHIRVTDSEMKKLKAIAASRNMTVTELLMKPIRKELS